MPTIIFVIIGNIKYGVLSYFLYKIKKATIILCRIAKYAQSITILQYYISSYIYYNIVFVCDYIYILKLLRYIK